LTVEVLGRILTVDLDDFGRAHVAGVTRAAGLQTAPPVPFATLLAQLLDHVWLDERAALPVPAEAPPA
jgi:hypothetical protein